MSRTKKGQKPVGYDWWSKRPFSRFHSSDSKHGDKYWKRQTHKIERQQGKKEIGDGRET